MALNFKALRKNTSLLHNGLLARPDQPSIQNVQNANSIRNDVEKFKRKTLIDFLREQDAANELFAVMRVDEVYAAYRMYVDHEMSLEEYLTYQDDDFEQAVSDKINAYIDSDSDDVRAFFCDLFEAKKSIWKR